MKRLLPLVLAGVLISACGSGGSPGGDGGTDGAASSKVLTAGQLRAALLTLSDLPEGFAVGSDDSDDESSDTSPCAQKFVAFNKLGKGASESQQVTYEKDVSSIGEELHVVANRSEARSLVEVISSFSRECPKLIVSDKQGTLNAKVAALDIPKVGDGSAGVNISGTVSAFSISINLVVARFGRMILLLSHGGLGPVVDDALTTSLLVKAASRLEKCLAGCAELPLSALPTPSVLESVAPAVAKAWPSKWCSARLGMTRAQMRAVMGNPTEELLPDSGNPQMSWDAFEFQFNAFFDVNDRVRQLDVNDIQLSKTERASIHCEFVRTVE
jgi:hypothetical protein